MKELKLTNLQYKKYLELTQIDDYSWWNAIGEILGIDPNSNFIIKNNGTSSIPEDGIIIIIA